MIVNPPSNLTVAMGQIAGFECGTIGFSPPFQVTWFKDSVEFRISSGDTRLFVTPETGTLFIRDVETLDAGSYHCTVNNAAGMLTSMTALLSVVTEPSSLGMILYDSNMTCAIVMSPDYYRGYAHLALFIF